MPKVDPRPPAQIIESITVKAANVRTAATALSERIEEFQEYVTRLPGRVEAVVYGDHPDAMSPDEHALLSLVLRFHREGKAWMLSYGTHHEEVNNDPDNPVKYQPLTDAPLRIKLAAVKMFPAMLSAVEKSQDDLVKEIESATAEYDAFAQALKIKPKEGK